MQSEGQFFLLILIILFADIQAAFLKIPFVELKVRVTQVSENRWGECPGVCIHHD